MSVTQSLRRLTITIFMALVCLTTFADNFYVDGIYYTKNGNNTVSVIRCPDYHRDSYSGLLTIPSLITYNRTTYSVTAIGYGAFASCQGLTSVTIPISVTSIGNYAFLNCQGLISVKIPGSVITIGSNAFSNCNSLTSVTIPGSVTSIGDNAFSACSGLTSITIPASVTNIGDNAFSDCSGLTSVKFFCSLTKLANRVFYGCSGLTSVTIPNSVTTIGDYAFSDCHGLTSVTIPNSVTNIGAYAFSDCSGLTSVTIPNSVTNIGDYAFSNCSGLTSATISNSVTNIGAYAFSDCSGLTSVTIPNSVTTIGDYAFSGCSGLSSVAIPNSVTTIGDNAFSGCSGLSSVAISNSVTSIGSSVFSGCHGLTSVTIPNSVTSIGRTAFLSCSSLNSVIIGSAVSSIDPVAFYGCPIYKAFWLCDTPPEGASNLSAEVNYVSNSKFSLNNQKIYPFLSSMFEVDNLVYVPVSPSDRTCMVIDCKKQSLAGDLIISRKIANKGVEMDVIGIGDYAFADCGRVTGLRCEYSGNIGDGAFRNLSNLAAVDFGKSVKSVGSFAFGGCSKISNLFLPASIESIGNNAFAGCCSLSDVTIEDGSSVLSLGSNSGRPLFYDCPLDEVYIGRKLSYSTNIQDGYSPFYRNKSLRAVRITNAETEIYDNEFYGCSGLQSLEIGDGVTTIGSRAFSRCSAMQTFACGSKVETIGEEAFSDCTGLTSFWSKAVNPPVCGNQALDDINKQECVLHVPAESEPMYQAAPQWTEFFNVNGDALMPVTAISLQHTAEMKVGETQMIRATVTPAGATLEWSSSDESVASVNFNGTVTAIAPGNVTITATAADGSGVTASCDITVSDNAAIGNVDAAEATVRVIGGEIVVEGAPAGTVVRIFAVDGMELYRSVSAGEAIVFAPGVRGICLVAVGHRCVRISL